MLLRIEMGKLTFELSTNEGPFLRINEFEAYLSRAAKLPVLRPYFYSTVDHYPHKSEYAFHGGRYSLYVSAPKKQDSMFGHKLVKT